jgi:hypothetical protein
VGALGVAPLDDALSLAGTESPVRCVAAPPLIAQCHGLVDAQPGKRVHFEKLGHIPVLVFSSVRGWLGGCNADDFDCGTYAAEVAGEGIFAEPVSMPVVVVGFDA